MNTLSVIIPCFNEELVIHETVDRLTQALKILESNYKLEFIFVNDGSKDKTLEILTALANGDSRIKVLSFSRNFGHQIAITAGLDLCSGDAAVVIDADLQDPPEVIPEMVKKWEEGFNIVYGKRNIRKKETFFKLFTAKLFYRFINKISETDIPLDTGDFRLMDRQSIDAFKKMSEQYRFVRGMISWLGFKQIGIPYDRDARFAGETKYPLKKMIRLAVNAILSFSAVPLSIATWLGFITAGLSFAGIFYALYLRLFTQIWVEGWTLLMISILFIGGMILIVLGIIGEYIGRIYGEIKGRPLYIIQDRIGF
ncbi:MAG: glycosyltransferase family 2 protein [Bacteroidetes bacterium]|nr:glycosyltransferase family 2 protein [Bacteroidota bacterium]